MIRYGAADPRTMFTAEPRPATGAARDKNTVNAGTEQIVTDRPDTVQIRFAGTVARGDNRGHNSQFFHLTRLPLCEPQRLRLGLIDVHFTGNVEEMPCVHAVRGVFLTNTLLGRKRSDGPGNGSIRGERTGKRHEAEGR